MMKEMINEHDMTKEMMKVIRGFNKKEVITENEVKDDITPVAGDAVYNEYLKELQTLIHPSANITSFKIYPNDGNVIIEGYLLKGTDPNSGVLFKLDLLAGELQTSMSGIELDDKVSDALSKLQGYYSKWYDDWSIKMQSEYKGTNNGNGDE